MERFLKWGIGLLAIALTMTPFLFTQYGHVVEGKKSSATLSYIEDKRNVESVIIIEKDAKEIANDNRISQLPNDNKTPFQRYSLILKRGVAVKNARTKEEHIKLKQKMDELRKQAELERLKLIELEKERLAKLKLKEKQKPIPSRGEVDVHDKYYVNASAYVSNCSEGCSGRTYTGYDVTNTVYYNGLRIIATDKNIIPMYSIVKITYNGNQFYGISLDTGGGIKGYKIDLLVNSYKEAISFGRRNVLVEVIKYGKN
jgi:3D (Asp-Asp-Asp) domain-containing protein